MKQEFSNELPDPELPDPEFPHELPDPDSLLNKKISSATFKANETIISAIKVSA